MNSKRAVLRLYSCLLLAAALIASSDHAGVRAEDQLSNTWTRCGGPIGGLGYDVRMHPLHPDTMFVTDSFAGVFRSFDGGQNWQPVNNGITIRGGFSGDAIKVFCLTIDPVNPSTVWLGLQDYRGIYKSTDLGENWTLKVNGITETEGISFRGITIDPNHPDTVYAAGEISSFVWADSIVLGYEFDKTMGVVYKTENGGDDWYEIWRGDNLARYIWIDPRNTQILYVSTGIFDREAADSDTTTNYPGGVGILKSTNGGTTWSTKNNGLTNLYIGSLFMHPKDPDILLAGADNGSYGEGVGVFRTIDGGDNWTKVLAEGANSVEFSQTDSLLAYAGNSHRIFRSQDGGVNWDPMTPSIISWGSPGIEAGVPIDFQVDPRDPYRIFANNYGGGNFMSADSGHTWAVASKGYTGAHVRDLAVAGDDPAHVYAAARTGLFVSYNSGEDWDGLNYPVASGVEWNAVAINPLNSLHLLAANNMTATIYVSRDGAVTWQDAGAVLSELKAWRCFAFAPSDTQMVYAGTGASFSIGRFDGNKPAVGIFKSTDGGMSWAPANDSISQYANVAELAVQPDNPQVVYAACSNQGIMKTINGGGDWALFNTGLPVEPRPLSVAIDPLELDHILAGLDDAGLYESFNGGLNWDPVPVGLPAEADVMDIVYCPTDGVLIYLADLRSGVYRSTNGGVSWIPINNNLRTKAVNALAFSSDGQVLYAGTEGEAVFRLDEAGPVTAVENPPPSTGIAGLRQNFPNPFNPGTTIGYSATIGKHVRLAIYDVAGRLVKVLVDKRADSTGRHEIVWDGRYSGGNPAASGVYFCRLKVGDHHETKKMVLIR
jgi:photosystem II stability/assembly factor-like uncharacterized protein